jgi:uncharacterized protein (TIGR02996 family)
VTWRLDLEAERVRAATRNLELEAELARTDDPDTYRVYADWLIQRGDPHGELIALDLARETEPYNVSIAAARDVLLANHRDDWLGALPTLHPLGYTWRRGFIATAFIEGTYTLRHTLGMEVLAGLWITSLLREVTLAGRAVLEELVPLFEQPRPPRLTTLRVNVHPDDDESVSDDTLVDEVVRHIRGTSLLRALRVLDLSSSLLSERGGATILAEPEHFAHLDMLVVGETWLNLATIKRMRAAGLNVDARWHPLAR